MAELYPNDAFNGQEAPPTIYHYAVSTVNMDCIRLLNTVTTTNIPDISMVLGTSEWTLL